MLDKRVLLVDVGNTRIKYCFLGEETDEASVASIEQLIAFIEHQSQLQHVWLACVQSEQIHDVLQATCVAKNLSLHNVISEKSAFGIVNCYQFPEKMGVDRWLAMIAAAQLTALPFAVIDAGTAITCDVVDGDGLHLGGWITPGFQTMRNALLQNTQKVTGDNRVPERLLLGQSTEECVAMGCRAAVEGVFLTAKSMLSERFEQFSIILTGGDKKVLTSGFQSDKVSPANLVLHGLARYARSSLQAYESSK